MRRLPAVVSPRRTPAAGEAHLRGCADCQRVTPELDVLRAASATRRCGSHPARSSEDRRSRRSSRRPVRPACRRGQGAGGGLPVPPRCDRRRGRGVALLMPDRADGADWDLTLYANKVAPAAVVRPRVEHRHGTHLRVDVDGLAPAGPNEYYAIWMSSDSGQHVPAGTFRQSGHIESWSGVTRADFPRIWITLEPDDGDERLTGRRSPTRLAGDEPVAARRHS